ncbi:hypothetical protein [Pseudalkalibacillus hwajinpoensis]|uniref:Uncharacterized protein n=1 Tax=Guptibacillus hwajinpoensis TaxID=208199 RepID=A0A4U1MMY6_9BACL|nr:hypothetical protein [Pseudalkalibacillus hwajinpoensis]TKD72144.1 hypothetical protein FBF83_04915 [Pseudalkalibacillus hwajinpoensis]
MISKTVIIAFLSYLVVSSILLIVGHTFHIKVLMFQFYEETTTGFVAGGSVVPFIIAALVSYLVGRWYEKRRRVVSEK